MKEEKIKETTHSFEVNDVKKYGSIEKALIMKEIKNKSIYKIRNNKNGWVYYSRNALMEKFPYLNASSIKRWMLELEKNKFLKVKIKNKFKYDKTKSYFPTEYSALIKDKKENSDQNGLIVGQNDQPIGQNDQPIGQNDQTIPTLSSSLSTTHPIGLGFKKSQPETSKTSFNSLKAKTQSSQETQSFQDEQVPKLAYKKKKGQTRSSKANEQTGSNEINQLLDLFRKINPFTNFANKTERGVLQTILNKFGGFRQTKRLIEYAMSIQGKQYAPTITKPSQLKNKLGELIIYYKKEKANNEPTIVKI